MAHASDAAAHAADPHAHDDHEHEITPLSTYFKVFGALLVLTVVTVGISFLHLGPASFAVAMIVAIVKASVVAGWFMHLKYDDKLYTLVFLAGVGFISIFFAFTYLDLFTRTDLNIDTGNYDYNRDRAWKDYVPEEEAVPQDTTDRTPADPAPIGGDNTIDGM